MEMPLSSPELSSSGAWEEDSSWLEEGSWLEGSSWELSPSPGWLSSPAGWELSGAELSSAGWAALSSPELSPSGAWLEALEALSRADSAAKALGAGKASSSASSSAAILLVRFFPTVNLPYIAKAVALVYKIHGTIIPERLQICNLLPPEFTICHKMPTKKAARFWLAAFVSRGFFTAFPPGPWCPGR